MIHQWKSLHEYYNMEAQKIVFLKFKIEFCPYPECPYPEKRNHHGFVNISPTLVIDTSMERSSRVLQLENVKILFYFILKFEIKFWLVFWLTCFFKFEIEFWLVPKSWNYSSRSHHAPIWRHRGCIIVPSRVYI